MEVNLIPEKHSTLADSVSLIGSPRDVKIQLSDAINTKEISAGCEDSILDIYLIGTD